MIVFFRGNLDFASLQLSSRPSIGLCLQPLGSLLNCGDACLLSGSEGLSNCALTPPARPVTDDTCITSPPRWRHNNKSQQTPISNSQNPPRKQLFIAAAWRFRLSSFRLSSFIYCVYFTPSLIQNPRTTKTDKSISGWPQKILTQDKKKPLRRLRTKRM